MDHVSRGHARSLTERFAVLSAVVIVLSLTAACRSTDAPGAESSPALIGRATPAPDRCPPEQAIGFVGPLSRQSLQWMGEPVIACGPFAEDEVYRFIALSPDRSAPPFSVRLSRVEAQALLVARQYAWAPSPDSPQPLSVLTSKVRPVAESEWANLTTALRAAGFWEMAADDNVASSENVVLWDLEGRLGDGYHYVERRPSVDGPFREIVRHVLTLAGYADRLE